VITPTTIVSYGILESMKLEEVESLTKEYIERYWGLPGVNKDKISRFVFTLKTWDFRKNLVEDKKEKALKYLTKTLPSLRGMRRRRYCGM
jgi:hypothetical protein